jgi:hypothetical protein
MQPAICARISLAPEVSSVMRKMLPTALLVGLALVTHALLAQSKVEVDFSLLQGKWKLANLPESYLEHVITIQGDDYLETSVMRVGDQTHTLSAQGKIFYKGKRTMIVVLHRRPKEMDKLVFQRFSADHWEAINVRMRSKKLFIYDRI